MAALPYSFYGGVRDGMLCQEPEVLSEGAADTGKAQPLSSVVWTPDGPQSLGDLQVGDLVLTPDGGTAHVLAVYPQGVQGVYRITFSDRRTVDSTLDHLWVVRHTGMTKRKGILDRFVVQETLTLRKILSKYMIGHKNPQPKYWIPQTAPVAFQSRAVPVDPYVLGILLGDGHLRKNSIFLSTGDEEILERVQDRLGADYIVKHVSHYDYRIAANGFRPHRGSRGKPGYARQHTLCNKWVATGRLPDAAGYKYLGLFDTEVEAQQAVADHAPYAYSEEDRNGRGIWNDLSKLGLLGSRSHNKFVPDLYKWNSVDVRLDVLCGILDSDGWIDKRSNGTPILTSTSRHLVEDTRDIVESLGGTCTMRAKPVKGYRDAFNLRIQHEDAPDLFYLTRKKQITGQRLTRKVKRWIKHIEPIGEQECACIQIDHPDQCYLTDHFIVTHNTLSLLTKIHTCAVKYPGAQITMVRKVKADLYPSAVRTYKRDILDDYAPEVKAYGGQIPQWYDFPNGSRIWLGGLDEPGKTLSTERDIVYVNQAEELTLSDWEYLVRVTAGRGAVMPYTQVVGDCNPGPPTHWILQRAKAGMLELFHTKHVDNPILFTRDGQMTPEGQRRLQALQRLTGTRRQRLYLGLWASPEGAIFEAYDEEKHTIEAFNPPLVWPRFVGIDPYGAQICALWLAYEAKADRIHVYREYMEPYGISTVSHAEQVLAITKKYRETIFAYVGGGPTERQQRLDWSTAGIPLIASPVKDVWSGLDRIIELLEDRRLVIHDCCVNLISEMGHYHRKQDKKTGVFTDKIADKGSQHAIDSLRYVSSWLVSPREQERLINVSIPIGPGY